MDSSDEEEEGEEGIEEGSSSSGEELDEDDDIIDEEERQQRLDDKQQRDQKKRDLDQLKENCKAFVEGSYDGFTADAFKQPQSSTKLVVPGTPKQPRKKNILIKETCKEQEERIR